MARTEVTNLYEARKDKNLMRTLYSLTLRGYSEMRTHMHLVCEDEFAKQTKIILAREKNKIVGWALIYPFSIFYFAHFYVARNFRRKGIGTILYNKAKELCVDRVAMYCSAWDRISAAFYARNKAKTYTSSEEKWRDFISSSLTEIYLD